MSRRRPLDAAQPSVDAGRGVTIAVIVGVAFLAIAHVVALAFLYDDAFISFRYADHMARGLGLIYNPGERVEGYSNFLWTVVMALVIRLGGAPETWSVRLDAVFGLAALAAVIAAAWRRARSGAARAWSVLAVGVLLAAHPGWAAWSTGGLETPLFMALVTGGTVALSIAFGHGAAPSRLWLLSAIAFGLGALTRPDGLLPAACAGAVVVVLAVRGRCSWRAAAAWAALVALCVVPHLLWRVSFYGHWLPNTFFVKSPGASRLTDGAAYLWNAFLDLNLAVLIAPILLALILRVHGFLTGSDRAVIAAIVVPYTAYLATTGGDFMPVYRFVAPVLPLATLVAADAIVGLARAAGRRAAWAFAGVVVAVLATWIALQARVTWHQQSVWVKGELVSVGWARQEIDEWTRIGDLLRVVAAPTDTLATNAGGAIPYRSGLYTIDLLGLNAPDLSRYRALDSRRPGHTMLLEERWLDERPPQILLGHPLVHPTTASLAIHVELRPEWHDRVMAHYDLVGLTLPGEPRRYVGCALRRDVTERILEAGRRAESNR